MKVVLRRDNDEVWKVLQLRLSVGYLYTNRGESLKCETKTTSILYCSLLGSGNTYTAGHA
jgi:hypothetical protein